MTGIAAGADIGTAIVISTGTDSAWGKGTNEDMMTMKKTEQSIIESTTDEVLIHSSSQVKSP